MNLKKQVSIAQWFSAGLVMWVSPSSNLGIDCFYAPTPTIQDEYPLTS